MRKSILKNRLYLLKKRINYANNGQYQRWIYEDIVDRSAIILKMTGYPVTRENIKKLISKVDQTSKAKLKGYV